MSQLYRVDEQVARNYLRRGFAIVVDVELIDVITLWRECGDESGFSYEDGETPISMGRYCKVSARTVEEHDALLEIFDLNHTDAHLVMGPGHGLEDAYFEVQSYIEM